MTCSSRFLLSVAAVLFTTRCKVAAEALSGSDQDAMLSLHLSTRSSVNPSAANMQQMTWDDGLSQQASDYAATCSTSHSHTSGQGENLAWGTLSDLSALASFWTNEGKQWSMDATGKSSCSDSAHQCGHYTQMVWATSNKLGCGKAACANIPGMGAGTMLVCRYSPAGNVVGQAPYVAGTSQLTSSSPAASAASPSTSSSSVNGAAESSPAQSQPSYSWHASDWSGSCSASCGQGVQGRSVYCQDQTGNGQSDDKCASAGSKPASSQSCQVAECPPPVQQQQQQPQHQEAAAASTGSSPTAASTPAPAAAPVVSVQSVQAASLAPETPQTSSSSSPAPATAAASSSTSDSSAATGSLFEPTVTASVCTNTTAWDLAGATLNDPSAMNATGLINQASGSLNCTQLYSFLQQLNVTSCSEGMSRLMNETGYDTFTSVGDCYDSWQNTTFNVWNSNAQSSFGQHNFNATMMRNNYADTDMVNAVPMDLRTNSRGKTSSTESPNTYSGASHADMASAAAATCPSMLLLLLVSAFTLVGLVSL